MADVHETSGIYIAGIFKAFYINCFHGGEGKIGVGSLVTTQARGDNFWEKDSLFKQFGGINIPVSSQAYHPGHWHGSGGLCPCTITW